MKKLKHRERVMTALDHQEPDRVPLGAYTMTDVCYKHLREHLGLGTLPSRYQGDVSDVVAPHEDLLQRLDLDTRDVQVTTTTPRLSTQESDERYKDDLGIEYRKYGVYYYYPAGHPLAGELTVADVERYPWPDPARDGEIDSLVEEARRLRRESDCALVLNVGGTMFAYAWFLCGDDWFINLATNAPVVDALMEKLLEVQLGRAQRILSALGPDGIDIAICTTDDLGMQSGLLISPTQYRRFIKPRQRVFFDHVRSLSDAKIFMHNDGAIYPLIPDFIEIGVDILNPVQVECDNLSDTKRLKREFGQDLSFFGAINIQETLTFGTPQDVRDEIRRRIEDLAPGGGYILTPRWALRPEVPPENIFAIYEAVDLYGGY